MNKNVLIKKYMAFSKRGKIPIAYNKKAKISFPYLFCTPKFHKNPLKFRYICSNSNCIGNNINNIFQKQLQKIYNILKFKYKDERKFWVVDNSASIISCLESCGSIFSIQTYDFENLFTNIPIAALEDILFSIFNLISKDVDFEGDYFRELSHFCLYNNYVFTGQDFYIQNNGIGMGTSYSSTAANLFLFYFEFNFCSNSVYCFVAFRYVDDIIIANLDSDFDILASNIYPSYLTLKKTNILTSCANFLDLKINIVNDTINFSIYDKRDDFNFKILSYIHWSSNIHKKIYSNLIINQIFRLFRICTFNEDFDRQRFLLISKLFYDNNIPIKFINRYAFPVVHSPR